MRLLFVGDVVGKPGRRALLALVPKLKAERSIDVVVVNCENAAGGKGITPVLADEFLAGPADVLTSGNHVWSYREIIPYFEHERRLIRPANYPHAPGEGAYRLDLGKGRSLGVIQVEGRVYMSNLECPFRAVGEALDELGPCTATMVDFHAEATSEKQALGWYWDGKVSAVLGTHTHVQTADERVLPHGTAYITDAGMTGPHDSVIGMRTQAAIDRFLTQRRQGHHVAKEHILLCGVTIDIDEKTGKATAIERVRAPYQN